jgi:sigma-B regulation protein RsbU (phosphoserine phosphatase)
MDTGIAHLPQDGLPLEQQVARLQALLEATRQVHSTMQVNEVLMRAACILVRELEMEGALFLSPAAAAPVVLWGSVPAAPYENCPRYPLLSKEGRLLAELIVATPANGEVSLYEQDFIEGLVLQTAVALENATLHERDLEWVRVQQDLNVARSIQSSLLPRGLRDLPYLAVTGVQLPCHAVGGDYFDVFPIDDDHTAILIADVSGKGLGAALLATMIQGALSGMAIGADPARLFNHLNRFLCEHAEVGRYATMFFGVIRSDGTLEFIKAGHPSPLILRGGEVSDLYYGGSFPVGLLPDATFTSSTVKLQLDDTLVLFSDGITEAEDPEENMFGVPRLREVLMGQQSAPLDHLQRLALESVERFAGGASQSDDMTLLIVHYRGPLGNDSGPQDGHLEYGCTPASRS